MESISRLVLPKCRAHLIHALPLQGRAVAAENSLLVWFHSVGYDIMAPCPTTGFSIGSAITNDSLGFSGTHASIRMCIVAQARPSILENPTVRKKISTHYLAREAMESNERRGLDSVRQQAAAGDDDGYFTRLPSDLISLILLFCSVRGSYPTSVSHYRLPPHHFTFVNL
jgi:hypothetical protein